MEILLLIALVSFIPLVGILIAKSRLACAIWVTLFVAESAAYGWFLSSLSHAMRWDGPKPKESPTEAALFLSVAALVFSIVILGVRAGWRKTRLANEMRRRRRASTIQTEISHEWKTLRQINAETTDGQNKSQISSAPKQRSCNSHDKKPVT